MPGSENLIRRFVYSTPATITCCCIPFTNRRYPCGIRWIEHSLELLVGFNYPSVSLEDQSKIYACAATAGSAAWTAMSAVVGLACAGTLGAGCFAAIIAAIPVGNETLQATFFQCLRNAGLSEEIISQCNIGIYTRQT